MNFLKNKVFLSIFISLVLVFSVFVVAENIFSEKTTKKPITGLVQAGSPANSLLDTITRIESCRDIPYEEEERVYGDCTKSKTDTICDDYPLNKSCHDETREVTYRCLKETRIVQKIRKDCTTTGFIINDAIKLNTQNYGCSVEETNNKMTIICDSKYDGNADGICKSGESCMKFVFDGTQISTYEKNSRNDFVESDQSFFLERAPTEVLK